MWKARTQLKALYFLCWISILRIDGGSAVSKTISLRRRLSSFTTIFLTRREALKILVEIRIIFRIEHVTVSSYCELQG